jgi:predicted RecA/RadA family phage recombinase
MAKNFIEKGNRISYTVPGSTAILVGQVIEIGVLHGVALQSYSTSAPNDPLQSDINVKDGKIQVALGGVWSLPKASGSSTAITLGSLVYWDATNKVVTTTSSGNKVIGVTFAASVDADTIVPVLINIGVQ